MPALVFANERGEIQDFPGLEMAGRCGREFVRPALEDLIALPEGSDLFVMPERYPVGYDAEADEFFRVEDNPDRHGEKVHAVAAFMAPAHTATLLAAFDLEKPDAVTLPLFAYSAVGWHKGRFWVCGFRSDEIGRAHV